MALTPSTTHSTVEEVRPDSYCSSALDSDYVALTRLPLLEFVHVHAVAMLAQRLHASFRPNNWTFHLDLWHLHLDLGHLHL